MNLNSFSFIHLEPFLSYFFKDKLIEVKYAIDQSIPHAYKIYVNGEFVLDFEYLHYNPIRFQEELILIFENANEVNEFCETTNAFINLANGVSGYTINELLKFFDGQLDVAKFLAKTTTEILKKDKYKFVDNFRFAEIGNTNLEKIYKKIQNTGCCGYYDEIFKFKNRQFMIGFN